MGLNDLQLTPSILSTLYPSSLVNLEGEIIQHPEIIQVHAPKPAKAGPIDPVMKYLGNNQKNILIVVNCETAVHLPDEALGFLTNLLVACKLSLGDVVIINKKNHPEETYKDLITNFKSRIVFLFGLDPVSFGLPVNFPHYQVQNLANCTFLHTPALDEQQNDPLLKSKLWVSLRNIFGI